MFWVEGTDDCRHGRSANSSLLRSSTGINKIRFLYRLDLALVFVRRTRSVSIAEPDNPQNGCHRPSAASVLKGRVDLHEKDSHIRREFSKQMQRLTENDIRNFNCSIRDSRKSQLVRNIACVVSGYFRVLEWFIYLRVSSFLSRSQSRSQMRRGVL